MIINKHDFNSEWLGCKSGIITCSDFFLLNEVKAQDALREYSWVEFRTDEASRDIIHRIYKLGFYNVDTQIKFTLDLSNIKNLDFTNNLTYQKASDIYFQINSKDIYPFKNERFLSLPNVTQEMVNDRYVRIANLLIDKYPQCCLRILCDNEIQGWYIAKPNDVGVDLTLAMLHKNAKIRGSELYKKAISVYAQNFSVAMERFSIHNTAVHNILSKLGARFLRPEGVWFWVKDQVL